MAFIINQNFDLKAGVKDFERQNLVLDPEAENSLAKAPESWFPDDYTVTIDGVIYIFNSKNSADANTGKWRKLDVSKQSNVPQTSISGGSAAESGKYVTGVTASGQTITVTKANLSDLSLNGSQIKITAQDGTELGSATEMIQLVNQSVADIKNNTVNGIKITNNPVLSGDNINVTGGTLNAALKTVSDNIAAINNSKGKANGIATLGDDGKVPSTQLPSYVDDVIEFTKVINAESDLPTSGRNESMLYYVTATKQLNQFKGNNGQAGGAWIKSTPEGGKIYIATADNNKQYRWGGTDAGLVPITSGNIVIGDITGTAFDGGRGKALEDKVNSVPSLEQVVYLPDWRGFTNKTTSDELAKVADLISTTGRAYVTVCVDVPGNKPDNGTTPTQIRIVRSANAAVKDSDIYLEAEYNGKYYTCHITKGAGVAGEDGTITYSYSTDGTKVSDIAQTQVDAIKNYTVNGIKISENPVLDGNNINITMDNMSGTLTESLKFATALSSQIMDSKGKANGYASLDAEGKVPLEQIPEDVKNLVILAKILDTKPTKQDGISVGSAVYVKADKKIYTATAIAEDGTITWNAGESPLGTKIYLDISTKYQYLWDGADLIQITFGQVTPYTLPAATDTVLGGVKVDPNTTDLKIEGGVIKLTDKFKDSKVDKVDGKGLSTNDFTNDYKNTVDLLKNVNTIASNVLYVDAVLVDFEDVSNHEGLPTNPQVFVVSELAVGTLKDGVLESSVDLVLNKTIIINKEENNTAYLYVGTGENSGGNSYGLKDISTLDISTVNVAGTPTTVINSIQYSSHGLVLGTQKLPAYTADTAISTDDINSALTEAGFTL